MNGDHPQVEWVSKGWGGERILDNRKEYCGKILYIMKDKKMSVHYHKIKTETFWVLEGKVLIRYWDNALEIEKHVEEKGERGLYSKLDEVILEQDDTFFVFPGRVHQILGLKDSKILEISTQDFPEDSIRIVKGD